MRELTFHVPEDYDNKQLKIFLRKSCKVSHGILTAMKWIYNGIVVNGDHAYVTKILHSGDIVTITIPDSETDVPPYFHALDIIYEDDDLLIVNKPSDMPIHPSPGHDIDSLANAISYYLKNKGENFYYHPVYRLDKNTSGIVVLGKNSYVTSCLSKYIDKTYYAVCEGVLLNSGTINANIQQKEGYGIQREVGYSNSSQNAVTNYRVIWHTNDHTLLKIRLETGRTHQIRVHLSHIGHPLAGDDMYGGSRQFINRHALHCGEVSFVHPVTSEPLTFYSEIPNDMKCVINKF